jgi:phosphatidylserine decarboxylase
LTSNMYHRFHAPYDCAVDRVTFMPGDTWNVNPAALNRVARLYCRNTRAIVPLRLDDSAEALTLVPVGAILVASIQLSFLPVALDAAYTGPHRVACDASFRKGDEMGYFRHGSTIVVLATAGLALDPHITEGRLLRVGQPLWRHRPPP